MVTSSNLLEAEYRSACWRESCTPSNLLLSAIDWIIPIRPLEAEFNMAWRLAICGAAIFGMSQRLCMLQLHRRRFRSSLRIRNKGESLPHLVSMFGPGPKAIDNNYPNWDCRSTLWTLPGLDSKDEFQKLIE